VSEGGPCETGAATKGAIRWPATWWFAKLNRARGFAESADLRETMQKVGVIDKPDIYFLNG
jgi:hypothetical protein